MIPALQAVLRQALIKAVLAYLAHWDCTHPQADIDRVKNIKDDETLKLVSHASFNGVAWKVVLHDAEFNPHTGLSIPLDPMISYTFYLLILWREIERLRRATPETLGDAAREMAYYFESDAEFWVAGSKLFQPDAPPVVEDDIAAWAVRINALLMAYIEEFLA